MKLEQKATLVSSSTAAILVSIKMVIGIMSGSVAVLASAIDSFLDLAVSLFNFFALKESAKKADETFNFGRGKLEAIAAVVEGSIISLSALFIIYSAMIKFVHFQHIEHLQISIYVMLFSIILTAFLVYYLSYVAKKTNNLVIRADSLHYKTDLYSNAAVLLGLGIISLTEFEMVDPILGILIALYMLYSAYPIMKEGILMLLDIAIDEDSLEKIKVYLQTRNDINGFHDIHSRQSGSDIFITLHVVFTVSITLFDAHTISDQIEYDIAKLFENEDVHIIVHMDPYDDSIHDD